MSRTRQSITVRRLLKWMQPRKKLFWRVDVRRSLMLVSPADR
jgi:hypothetical protein